MAGPLTPAATALCRLAVVAGESSPLKEPLIVSFVPASVAEAEPEPARLARVLASADTADKRVLNTGPFGAANNNPSPPTPIPITTIATRRVNVISGLSFYIECARILAMRYTTVLLAIAALVPLRAADPTAPVYWSAAKTQELDKAAASRLNKARGLGTSRLMDSAFILYREGNSQAEIHTELADFIFFREGEGAVIVGGKIVNGKPTGAGEIRGDSIEGGTKYPVRAGDTLYVPKNTPHQFWLEPGQHFTATIVKVTPKE